MARATIRELKKRRLAGLSAAERRVFNDTYAAAVLAIRGGHSRDAGEEARPRSPRNASDSYLE